MGHFLPFFSEVVLPLFFLFPDFFLAMRIMNYKFQLNGSKWEFSKVKEGDSRLEITKNTQLTPIFEW